MLQTAPPETLEQAHAEAFAKLTPEQRQKLQAALAEQAPAAERAAITSAPAEDTRALARAATRAEVRQPGTMERTLGQGGLGFGAGLFSSFAAGFVGSMVANSFFSALSGFGGDSAHAEQDASPEDDAHHDDAQHADYGGDDGGFDGGGDFEV